MKSRPRYILALFIGCLLMLTASAGRVAMTRHQELRVALTARTMAEGGNWLIPEYRGETRLQKPPLMYWLVATGYRLAVRSGEPLVARFPSIVTGLLLVAVVYLGGRGLVGRAAAFLGACVTSSTFLFVRHAPLAETDMPLALFTALAAMGGYALVVRGSTVGAALWCGLAAGLGFLIKGPAAVLIPVLAILVFLGTEPRLRKRVRPAHVVVGVLLLLALVVPWYAAVFLHLQTQAAATDAVRSELGKLVVRSAHPGPWYYYFYQLPLGMLPWGVLLPWALWSVFGRGRQHRGTRFVLCWWSVTFVLLSVLTSKQEHYTLLLLPPSALMLGWFLATRGAHGPRERTVSAAALGLVFFAAGYFAVFYRAQHPESLIPEFAHAARPYTESAEKVHMVGRHATSLEFYLGRRVAETPSVAQAWGQAAPGDAIVVLSKPGRPTDLADVLLTPTVDMQRGDVRCALFVRRAR